MRTAAPPPARFVRPEDLVVIKSAIDKEIGQMIAETKEVRRQVDDLEAWRRRQGATVQAEQPESDVLVKLKGLFTRTMDEFGAIAELPEEWAGDDGIEKLQQVGAMQELFELGIRRGIEVAILTASSAT